MSYFDGTPNGKLWLGSVKWSNDYQNVMNFLYSTQLQNVIPFHQANYQPITLLYYYHIQMSTREWKSLTVFHFSILFSSGNQTNLLIGEFLLQI